MALATEDAFIWGQVRTGAPFFFPNREALVDLCAEIASTPGIDVVALTHCTLAPFVVDPGLIAQLSALLLPEESVPSPAQQASGEEGAHSSHRPRNGFRTAGEANHAGQGASVPDRRLAERSARRVAHRQREPLVPDADVDGWQLP